MDLLWGAEVLLASVGVVWAALLYAIGEEELSRKQRPYFISGWILLGLSLALMISASERMEPASTENASLSGLLSAGWVQACVDNHTVEKWKWRVDDCRQDPERYVLRYQNETDDIAVGYIDLEVTLEAEDGSFKEAHNVQLIEIFNMSAVGDYPMYVLPQQIEEFCRDNFKGKVYYNETECKDALIRGPKAAGAVETNAQVPTASAKASHDADDLTCQFKTIERNVSKTEDCMANLGKYTGSPENTDLTLVEGRYATIDASGNLIGGGPTGVSYHLPLDKKEFCGALEGRVEDEVILACESRVLQ